MNKNMGTADKAIRIILAMLVAVLYAIGAISGTVAIVLGIVAAIFLVTSFIGTCLVYLPFGINTCGTRP